MQRRQFVQVLAALPLGSSALTGMAQIVGDKPLQIIVPFGPGGSGDITARMLAEFITKKTGRPAMVDNRPGANGIVGVEAVRKSPPDGSVVLLATTSTHSANPSLYKKLPYDPERDFTLVGHFGGSSSYMLVKPNAPYKTLADFVQAAKAAPGKLNYGYFNASSQVPGALLGQVAGIELTAIPYKQVNTAMTELIAGQIDVIFVDSVAGDSFVNSGQLRALAAQSAKRLVKYPSVPLISETYPSYGVSGFLGIAVPVGTPAATLQFLNDLINEAITTDPMRARLEGFGFSPKKMSLSQLATFDKEERAKWKNYVAIARMEPQ
ncbi:Bug family tripartite tricarboxylate transporter substrate binding protein [Polaromonas sp. UC242_47]|uniref:Bug family tripartite tricarboxylate transporter substrate binding protein n=1 Tax=Polaromonas sp. UC242_47 TaxID=3374626 RepID=UPI00379E1236